MHECPKCGMTCYCEGGVDDCDHICDDFLTEPDELFEDDFNED